MPRDGTGDYSLPQPPFQPQTTISSAAVNSDFSDIEAALTGSLARDGQGGMTAQLRLVDAGFAFGNDLNCGIRRVSADLWVLTAGGTDIVVLTPTQVTIQGSLSVTASAWIATAALQDDSVTFAKMQNLTPNKVIGSLGGGGSPEEITCTAFGRSMIAANDAAAARAVLGLGTMSLESAADYAALAQNETITGAWVSTNAVGIKASNTAKALCTFTVSGTVVTVAKNYRISNVTRDGVGLYSVTLAFTLADTAYLVIANGHNGSSNAVAIAAVNKTATTFQIRTNTIAGGSALEEAALVSFAVFGDE